MSLVIAIPPVIAAIVIAVEPALITEAIALMALLIVIVIVVVVMRAILPVVHPRLAFIAPVPLIARLMLRLAVWPLPQIAAHVIATVVVAELVRVETFRTDRADGTLQIIHIATLADLLLAERHDDAIVMFCVLQIVLSQDRITGRARVTGKRHVFLGDVGWRTADFNVRAV
jgi:hypothetical protein